MKKTFLFSSALILMLILLLIPQQACKKEKDEPEPEPEIIIADQTKVVTDHDWNTSIISIDSSNFTITFNSDIDKHYGFTEGDIIISSVGQGLLREITNVESISGNIILKTEAASLSDAIVKGKLQYTADVSDPAMIRRITYISDGVKLPDDYKSGGRGFTINIEEDLGTDWLSIEGELEIGDFTFSGYYDWHCGGALCTSPVLDTANVQFVLTETLKLTGTIGKSIEAELSQTIFEAEYPTIIVMIGTVPVSITPVLSLEAGVEVKAGSSLSAGVEQTLEATGGLTYNGSNWDPSFNLEKSFDPIGPDLSATLTAKVYIKPQLGLKIYHVFCPNVSLEPYGLLEADLLDDPWWYLYAGISADIGLEIDVLIAELLDINYNLFDQRYEIANSGGSTSNTAPVAVFITDPPQGPMGTEFTFDASASYDEEDAATDLQVRWDWENDGEWDTEYSGEKITQHSYDQVGNITVNCEIKDTEGAKGSVTGKVKVWDENTGKPCPGIPTVTDADGNIYNTVQIGNQCWMAENLRTGSRINTNEYPSDNGVIEKYCYENDDNYCELYGALYNWQEMMGWVETQGTRGVCPEGWHLPTDGDWKVLEGNVDSQFEVGNPEWDKGNNRGFDAGFNLRSTNWWYQGNNGIDLFKFTVLPAGRCSPILSGDNCDGLSQNAFFWTSSIHSDSGHAYYRRFLYSDNGVYRSDTQWGLGYSVRCLKD
jgi:uncharacterized protein (TIGR02145 family)